MDDKQVAKLLEPGVLVRMAPSAMFWDPVRGYCFEDSDNPFRVSEDTFRRKTRPPSPPLFIRVPE